MTEAVDPAEFMRRILLPVCCTGMLRGMLVEWVDENGERQQRQLGPDYVMRTLVRQWLHQNPEPSVAQPPGDRVN